MDISMKEVSGLFGNYKLTEDGRVFSEITKKFLKPIIACGYPAFTARISKEKRKTFYIHREMAKAWIGHRPPGMQVRHLDGKSKQQ